MPAKRRRKAPIETVKITHGHSPHAHLYVMFRAFVLSTLLALGFVIISFLFVVGFLAYRYLHTVSMHSGFGVTNLFEIAKTGFKTTVPQVGGRENILILGVDALGNRDESTINTDTMMVASLNLKSGVITTFSVPRDLFLLNQKVKINGVYDVARKAGDAHPELKAAQAVEQVTGLVFQHALLLQMSELGNLIDALGGIDVKILRSFTDTQFPREDVDVSKVHDPALLYKTVTFEVGTEHMNGQRALEFMRSRHSSDPIEGRDDARALRQQQVIGAFITRLSDRNIVKNPAFVGDLIKIYRQDFAQYISLEEVVALSKIFAETKHLPTLQTEHLAVQGFDPNPVLYHPNVFYTGQWVYLPLDPSGAQIKKVINTWLQ